MPEGADPGRAEAELQKLRLEIQKLTLDVESARRSMGHDVLLRLLPSITVLVAVLGFGFSIWQYRVEQTKDRQARAEQVVRETTERAERARKDTEAAQREFMKPLLEKQQELYFEAASAAATIAASTDPAERRKAEGTFWRLFWGPLVMVESKEVSAAMKRFGNCLNAVEACDAQEKRKRSLALASALETSLLNTWNAKPEDFTKGQFLYR